MKVIDISRKLQNGMPNWPGDTPFSYEVSWSKEESGSVNVGQVSMSVHIGTHVDAPFHFDNEGKRIIDLDLDLYVGPATVIDVSGTDNIGAEHIEDIDLSSVERVLFKTSSWTDESTFPSSITYIHPNLIPALKHKGIRLIGVDVPSVDPLDSKELLAHHALHEANIHILEGLQLNHVEEGAYELIALPLPIEEGDGSPVRAVLRVNG